MAETWGPCVGNACSRTPGSARMVAESESMVNSRRSPEIITQTESATRAVRVLLGVSACFVLVAHRPFTRSPDWARLAIVVAIIAVGTFLLNFLSVQTQRKWAKSPFWITAGQTLDVAATVGLVVALDAPLQGQAFVLLVIPVVSGSVRHGTASAMLSWAAGCGAYAGLALLGFTADSDSVTTLVRASGVLLVIAATVGILARWMREGWEIQNELTKAAAGREKRLSTIETAARSMARLSPGEALSQCLHHSLDLLFDATSSRPHDSTRLIQVVGDADAVAKLEAPEVVNPGEVALTKWTTNQMPYVYSASVFEPITKTVVTGWSRREIDVDQAEALSTMVAQTTNAIETSTLLSRLRDQASNDSLTGLPNRRSFEQSLVDHAQESMDLAVGFVDVDYFKQVNDHYGHSVGDHVLVVIAQRLSSCLRPGDIAARIGGDEFVVLLRDASDGKIHSVGDALAQAMKAPIVVEGKPLFITLSIGFAGGKGPLDSDELLQSADKALYRAKEAGRNRIVYGEAGDILEVVEAPPAWPVTTTAAAGLLGRRAQPS